MYVYGFTWTITYGCASRIFNKSVLYDDSKTMMESQRSTAWVTHLQPQYIPFADRLELICQPGALTIQKLKVSRATFRLCISPSSSFWHWLHSRSRTRMVRDSSWRLTQYRSRVACCGDSLAKQWVVVSVALLNTKRRDCNIGSRNPREDDCDNSPSIGPASFAK